MQLKGALAKWLPAGNISTSKQMHNKRCSTYHAYFKSKIAANDNGDGDDVDPGPVNGNGHPPSPPPIPPPPRYVPRLANRNQPLAAARVFGIPAAKYRCKELKT